MHLSIAALSFLTMGGVSLTLALADAPREAQTRYGLASGTGPLNTLLINGQPTTPKIAGNSALFVQKIAESGDTDVVLLTSVGGQACDAQYSILQVTPNGIKTPTPFFGNCSTAKPSISGSKITLKFPRNIGKYVTTPAEVDVDISHEGCTSG
ncbi:hypothetical protein CRM93_12895 [Acetobacter fabarum]|uniref:Uncharacterized protein n=2 Tax=Acetobacter fabarum TaxID=483199 RepID=A0A269XUH8_9PROT|nr:hypothetical protein [Acetobacter fabarum]PAK76932.1 hypothetical protein B8X00_12375 [Acetobacter fabarum]PEN22647.1 hypothetical protein CRM93_12895 [Acetobacter fabarum]